MDAVNMKGELASYLERDFILDGEDVAHRDVKCMSPEGPSTGGLEKIQVYSDVVTHRSDVGFN